MSRLTHLCRGRSAYRRPAAKLKRYTPHINSEMNPIETKLKSAAQSNNPDEVESAVAAAFETGLTRDLGESLICLMGLEWHRSHEDIARALQELKDPSAVEVLYVTALKEFEYLNYDEFFGLARKCTWALADIGTGEAKDKLLRLAQCNNPAIQDYAQKRLDNWEKEISRKGV